MTRAVDVSLRPRITTVAGGSGSGKSAWTKQQVRAAPRLAVWDADDEYTADLKSARRFTSLAEFGRSMLAASSGRFIYVPTMERMSEQFDRFCQLVFLWGRCVVVAEELADVTTPGKAPRGWGQIIRRGRKHGIIPYAVTQRPAESDKTSLRLATIIHCGYLEEIDDREYMARRMGVTESDLRGLKPLEFIEINRETRTTRRGRVSI